MIEALRWKKFPLLNDGFVCLVDAMGDDQVDRPGRAGELRRGDAKDVRTTAR